jgi:transposase
LLLVIIIGVYVWLDVATAETGVTVRGENGVWDLRGLSFENNNYVLRGHAEYIVKPLAKQVKAWYKTYMGYDMKFRQRVIEYLSEGHTDKEASEVFKISTYTIWKWKSRLKETGTLAPKKRKETWRKIDPEKLRAFVASHPDAYQHEIAAAFGVRLYAIQKALKRLKITRKKNS